jgi:hypothetical protein
VRFSDAVTPGPVGRPIPFAPGGRGGERPAEWHHARMVLAVEEAIDGGFVPSPEMTPSGWLKWLGFTTALLAATRSLTSSNVYCACRTSGYAQSSLNRHYKPYEGGRMTVARNRTMDPWRRLVDLESHDLVKRIYGNLHGRELSTGTANDITALMAQGKEYFRNADNAAVSVRPLLQYYGVLALNRALIVLLSRSRALSALKPGHGLEITGWPETMAKGLRHLGDLTVTVRAGTFLELLDATGNCSPLRANSSRINWRVTFDLPRAGAAFSLYSLVRAMPDLRDEFSRWTGETPAFAVINSCKTDEAAKEVTFGFEKEITADLAEALFPPALVGKKIPPGKNAVVPESFMPALEQSYDRPFGIGDPEILPHIATNVALNTVGKLTALAYFLGMLVRYFPSTWMALGRSMPGDAIHPVVTRISELTQHRYPDAVLDLIDDATIRATERKQEESALPNTTTS